MPSTRPYISMSGPDLSSLFASVCLAGDRESYAVIVEEMGFRRTFNNTIDAFEQLGEALLNRSVPGGQDSLSVVHAVLGMGKPAEADQSGASAHLRIRELKIQFHSDKFVNADDKVKALADRFMAVLNSMGEQLPPKQVN